MLPDRVFYPLVLVAFAMLIALALVWPQGQGTPSPAPFGHPMAAPVKDPSLTEKLRAAFTQ
jgi:hypothetical protein